ncbi:MAG: EAL domain-containing protein, partial [bacterium]|nr:EAL domain-containing protein [bacterium]
KNALILINLILPFVVVFVPTIVILFLTYTLTDLSCIDLIASPFIYIFEHTDIDLLNGIIYAFISFIGMFFGIGLDESFQSAKMEGVINPNIMTSFVFIPLIIGFAISLLIFSKKKTDKIYGASAMPTSAFSLFKPVHYGYSFILNPFAIIPTLIIPIITTIITYFMILGFNINVDPNATSNFDIAFYNAYRYTGSYWSILIVFINVAISGLFFIPFILLNNYAKNRAFKENIKNLYPKYMEAKAKHKSITIFDFDYELGETAKVLCNQLIKDMELMKEVEAKVIELNKKRDSFKAKEFEIGKRELLNKLKKQLKIKSYFQPIVSNHVEFNEENKPIDFEIKGMECLMRWWFDGNYIIPPLALEIARDAHLEYDINYYLWQNMLINVDRKKSKSFITFNISMNCLENKHFVDDIMGLFERYDMDPSGFVIEITEEDEFSNEEEALKKICLLKEKGFDFAIDDYGAGQTSMKYFQTNAFELVKIDGDLVKKAKENEQVYDIIGNIRELGKRSQKYANIQFKVLCEFIEDRDSFERLSQLKVDYYQGYLFGKAQEFDEIASNEMMVKSGSQKHV